MEKIVDYTVTKVTVFPDRARITCSGEVSVSSEITHLVIDGLPLNLERDSLRAGGKGTAQVTIQGVDISSHFYEQSPSQNARDLEDKLDQLRDELDLLDDKNLVWSAQLEHLQGLRLATAEYAKSLSRGRTTVDDQIDLIQFFRQQDEEFRAEQQKIRLERRDLERRISKTEKELAELRSVQPQHRFQAKVAVEVFDKGEFWLEIDYVVRKAGWQPLYDIRLVEVEGGHELEISSIAQISQQTGQEWKGVKLSVSTARPALNQRLPDLKPWFIDEARPQPRRSARTKESPPMAVMSAPEPESRAIASQSEPMIQAEMVSAGVKDLGTSVRFDVPGIWDIPSDGSPHKMGLSSIVLEPDLNYLAIPKHTDAVYRRATIVNKGKSALLPGTASIFVGSEYIGKTQIAHTPAGGELELLLGVEENIVVERELTKRIVDKRLLRENRILRYAYKIELRNLLKSDVNVEVKDHIPVSKHEQIKIKLDQAKPEPDERSDLNLLEWHIDIKPSSEVEIGYEYTIEHPSVLKVVGLRE